MTSEPLGTELKLGLTLSLLPLPTDQRPFLYQGDLNEACRDAVELGYDGVELFLPAADEEAKEQIRRVRNEYGLEIAAIGTGAGWFARGLSLMNPHPSVRKRAIKFAIGMIELAAENDTSVIVGSLLGKCPEYCDRTVAAGWLREGITTLAAYAQRCGVPFLVEALNRFKSDDFHRVEQVMALICEIPYDNVKVLPDVYHMNIEEEDPNCSLREARDHIHYIHLADSNRKAPGLGHIDFARLSQTLREIGYAGYLTVEAEPVPSSREAAATAAATFRKYFV